MARLLIAAALLAVPWAHAGAEPCVAQSGDQRARLVELYTSEGCSSCPPADRWMSSLVASDQLIPLAFHVDYWDYIGWKDRFADPRFAERQQRIAVHGGSSGVYTPGVVVDGREQRRWARGIGHASQTRGVGPRLTLRAQRAGGALVARLELDAEPATHVRAQFALVEDGLSTTVRAGENRGATLRHGHVVRAWADVAAAKRNRVELSVPADVHWSKTSLVAWLEDAFTGTPLRTVRLPLASCAAGS